LENFDEIKFSVYTTFFSRRSVYCKLAFRLSSSRPWFDSHQSSMVSSRRSSRIKVLQRSNKV